MRPSNRQGRGCTWPAQFVCGPGSVLLISQVSLALALLVGTILLGESLERLLETNRAFRPEHFWWLTSLFPTLLSGRPRIFGRRNRASIISSRSASKASRGFCPSRWSIASRLKAETTYRFKADGTGLISENFQPAEMHLVTPSFLEIMNLKLVRGRWLAETDTLDSLPVAVINQAMAERYWPGSDPLGRKLRPMLRFTARDAAYTIVGSRRRAEAVWERR